MIRTAQVSSDEKYRYSLSRIWDNNGPLILWVMLNPSTADDRQDDPTIKKIISYSQRWGYAGLWVANLFAYRTTDPQKLKELTLEEASGGTKNDTIILQLYRLCDYVMFAWGNHGSLYGRDAEVKDLFKEAYSFGKTLQGQPPHPLYLPSNKIPTPFYNNEQ